MCWALTKAYHYRVWLANLRPALYGAAVAEDTPAGSVGATAYLERSRFAAYASISRTRYGLRLVSMSASLWSRIAAGSLAAGAGVASVSYADEMSKYFDPEALERGAKAVREINQSPHAKKVCRMCIARARRGGLRMRQSARPTRCMPWWRRHAAYLRRAVCICEACGCVCDREAVGGRVAWGGTARSPQGEVGEGAKTPCAEVGLHVTRPKARR